MRGRKSKLVVDRYTVQCRHNSVKKQKPKNNTKPKNKNTQAKQTKTHNTKQTEKGKSGRQTSYVTSVMSKRDNLVSSLVLVWQ